MCVCMCRYKVTSYAIFKVLAWWKTETKTTTNKQTKSKCLALNYWAKVTNNAKTKTKTWTKKVLSITVGRGGIFLFLEKLKSAGNSKKY